MSDIKNKVKKLTKCLKKMPCMYYLFCTEKNEYKKLKRIIGFFLRNYVGDLLLFLHFDRSRIYTGSRIHSWNNDMSDASFRDSLFLPNPVHNNPIVPQFWGKVGRGVLKAIVITFVISGPVENISSNGKEVVRVFACTASLTFNLTKTRFELMFKPFTQAVFGIKTEVNEVKDTVRSIKDVSAPITGELEDEKEMKKMKEENDYLDDKLGDTKRSDLIDDKYKTKGEQIEAERYEKQYLKKVEMRCEDQFTRASKKCRGMFEATYNKCYEAVTWIAAWLLCWPMKLDFVCNIAEALGGSKRCDPSKDVDPGFGEGYAYLKHSRSSFSKNFKDVRLQYKIGLFKNMRDVRDARDTAVAVMHVVNNKRDMLNKILVISQKYHDKYLRDIEFDNIYITKYFRKIDARRKVNDKPTVLPLKKD
ncbi:hypothetical protein NQ317_017651 [Molorchus minor]|uniref:Dendritic cell-specific transmembrane protein-like domain-containing protein n=1 Tax=Molorchus minor TaxID=1323400 RepID=A0ABQ9JKE1_9CUCU|nr:hypothetical protein NQ317_017651 [Molorchus minor]